MGKYVLEREQQKPNQDRRREFLARRRIVNRDAANREAQLPKHLR